VRPTSSSGSASMGYTSPRFRESRSHTPGPGHYSSRPDSPRRGGGRGLAESTAERSLSFGAPSDTPGAGSYEPERPYAPSMGRSASTQGLRKSAAFSSATPRFGGSRQSVSASPGPGTYGSQTDDDLVLARSSGGASRRYSPLRRSSSFSSTQARFGRAKENTPGPGSYANADRRGSGTPLRAVPASAVFASTASRDLPFEGMKGVDSPGPGAHEHSQPLRDSTLKSRRGRSSQFASTSPRFRESGPKTPPPGAYEPRYKHTTTQRYSVNRDCQS